MQLHNRESKDILRQHLEKEDFERITLSFYQYAHIEDPQTFRNELFKVWTELKVLGRIYVAAEGINGQLNVPEFNLEAFKAHLYSIPFLHGIRLNFAIEENRKSFLKLSVKLRDKIVADGIEDPSFDVTQAGKHLNAEAFNTWMENKESIVIDMRNHYESEVGHFEGAICPDVDTFRDSLPIVEDMLKDAKNKPVLLYCTGGIRCEKASAYLKHKGFEQVFQLEGGIIEYTRQTKQKGLVNKFIGKNFVFDERLGERITEDIIAKCHQCGAVCDDHTNCANEACHLLFIQCEACKNTFNGCCSEECNHFMNLPEDQQKDLRKGTNFGQNIFRKGRWGEKKFILPPPAY